MPIYTLHCSQINSQFNNSQFKKSGILSFFELQNSENPGNIQNKRKTEKNILLFHATYISADKRCSAGVLTDPAYSKRLSEWRSKHSGTTSTFLLYTTDFCRQDQMAKIQWSSFQKWNVSRTCSILQTTFSRRFCSQSQR